MAESTNPPKYSYMYPTLYHTTRRFCIYFGKFAISIVFCRETVHQTMVIFLMYQFRPGGTCICRYVHTYIRSIPMYASLVCLS
jgi:hypothetical protein